MWRLFFAHTWNGYHFYYLLLGSLENEKCTIPIKAKQWPTRDKFLQCCITQYWVRTKKHINLQRVNFLCCVNQPHMWSSSLHHTMKYLSLVLVFVGQNYGFKIFPSIFVKINIKCLRLSLYVTVQWMLSIIEIESNKSVWWVINKRSLLISH